MLLHEEGKDWAISDANWNARNTVVPTADSTTPQYFGTDAHELFAQALSNRDVTLPQPPLVVDVGANLGTHALWFASQHAETHAFEPQPDNYNLLRCSALYNAPFAKEYLHIYPLGVDSETQPQSDKCIVVADEFNMVSLSLSLSLSLFLCEWVFLRSNAATGKEIISCGFHHRPSVCVCVCVYSSYQVQRLHRQLFQVVITFD